MNEYKYLTFIELDPKPKTKVFEVRNKLSGTTLGYVKWYGPWRKYIFQTELLILIFDSGCLADLKSFIDELMAERKENK